MCSGASSDGSGRGSSVVLRVVGWSVACLLPAVAGSACVSREPAAVVFWLAICNSGGRNSKGRKEANGAYPLQCAERNWRDRNGD